MNDLNNKIHKQLSAIFWINFLFFILGFLCLLYSKGPDFGNGVESNVTFERYAIILTLASIPLALKLFHNIVNKANKENNGNLEKTYKKAYFIRLAILDIAAIVSIAGFYLYEANNFIYMTIVILAALVFCYPNKSILDEDISNENLNDSTNN